LILTARVPGKAVLAGEYAVLDGLPAVALAVNRRARVTLAPCQPGESRVSAPQLGIEPVAFSIRSDGRIDWDESASGWRRLARSAALIDHLCQALIAAGGQLRPFRLDIDTAELFLDHPDSQDHPGGDHSSDHPGDQVKLGLGSSSAVAVGLDAVLRAWVGRHDDVTSEAALRRLLPPYRQAQGGQGSGVDLATSLHGGLIRFLSDAATADDAQPRIKALSWPTALELRFVWTGKPASTPALLADYRAWQRARPAQSRAWLADMAALLSALLGAIEHDDAAGVVQALGAYGRGMGTMGGLMGKQLLGPVHSAIMEQAEALGLAAKPSGAGVGDLALIAGSEPDRMAAMSHWLAEQGLMEVPMALSRTGVELTRQGCLNPE